MASIRKCPKCGLDLTDTTVQTCPMCGTRIVAAPGAKIWLAALLQFALSSIFMLAFGFPKIMIAIFGTLILIGTALSSRVNARAVPASRSPQRPVAHPAPFRILSLAVALCSITFLAILLFGFVIFLNSWSGWQRYKAASYHRADFQVTRVYYQKQGKGTDVYASGTVEGRREWMNLASYVQVMPHGQSELEESVPAGTSIPIYLFPDMKGRSRVRVYQEVPTAESYHRAAMSALRNGLGCLAICGGILFLLLRLRAMCFEKNENAFAATA